MRFSIQLLFVFFLTLSCVHAKKADAAGWDVTIKGKVKFPQKGVIQIHEVTSSTATTPQPIELQKDGTFSTTLHVTEPLIFKFNFYGKQEVKVMVDHSNMELNVDGNDEFGAVEIIGSPDHDLYKKVELMDNEISELPVAKKIFAELDKVMDANDEKKIEELYELFDKATESEKAKITEFIKQQPPSLGLYKLLQDKFFSEKNLPLLTSALAKFQQNWPTYKCTKELATEVDIIKALEVGKVAPEIVSPNPEGQIIKLSSLRGKYVLIDFWASWCGGCRAENPKVVKAYHRFNSKGFEVYSVSLDNDKKAWVKAIKHDGLVWTQVSDLKDWKSQAAKEYNIHAIPRSILLDKNGVIVAKDLRGSKLEKKLEELLGK